MDFRIGDSVKIVKGTRCPGYEKLIIGGWQGRVIDLESETESFDKLVGIKLDSVSLNKLPEEYIAESEEEGIDYTEVYLFPDEIEAAKPRDTLEEATQLSETLAKKYKWFALGSQGRRIMQVLKRIDGDDIYDEDEAWWEFLRYKLRFPFKAVINDEHEKLPLGTAVSVIRLKKITGEGIVLEVQHQYKRYEILLCDIDVESQSNRNYQHVWDYNVWYQNADE